MFKTNSRKGLGLASIIALAASAFVGVTPAQAADVTVTPFSGTTYAAISGETFSVSAVVGSGTTAVDWQLLKYEIKNAANATLSATISPSAVGSASQSNGVTASSVVLAGATNSRTAVVGIQTATTASDVVLTVQAWIDLNGDNKVDANEDKSAVQTLNFYKAGNVTWTTTLTAPILGDTELVANVTSDKGINLSQTKFPVQVGFATVSASLQYATVSDSVGTTVSAAGAFTQGDPGTLNTAKTSTEVEVAHTVLAANTYVAQAVYGGVEIGAESVGTVGAAPVSNIDAPTLSKGVNVKGATVRTGTTDLSFTAVVSKSAGVAAADGTVVSIEISEGAVAGLATGATVTAGGKVLTNSVSSTVQKITFDVSVASGKVTVPVALSGLKAGNSITVKATNGNVSQSTTVTIADTAAGSLANLSILGTGGIIKAAKGGSYSLVFGALDNFDQPLSGDYRVTMTNSAATATVSQALVDGKVTFAVTDNADKSEGTYTAVLEKLSAVTNNYAATALGVAVTPIIGTSNAATKVTVTAFSASNLVLNAETQSAADTRVGQTAPKVTSGHTTTLSGQVTDANGLGTYAMVTLSAPDAMFEVDGVYSLGSVTVHTSATGAYSGVTVYRQLAGKVTVSAAVGSVTGDVGLTYLAASEAKASKITLTAPAGVASGTTFQVKGKLTDKFGNPVKVSSSGILSVKYTGPGFVTATLPTTTDADGEFMFSVLLGSADEGTATVTVAYDGDKNSATTTDNIAVTSAIVTGVTPEIEAKIGSFNGRWAVRVENAKGSVISIKAGNRWLKVTSTRDSFLISRKSRVGAEMVVKVYVDGEFYNEQTITIK